MWDDSSLTEYADGQFEIVIEPRAQDALMRVGLVLVAGMILVMIACMSLVGLIVRAQVCSQFSGLSSAESVSATTDLAL